MELDKKWAFNWSWLPAVIPIVVTLATALTPQLQEFVAAHPNLAVFLSGLYSILALVNPSPVVRTVPPQVAEKLTTLAETNLTPKGGPSCSRY